ncbi:FAD:protein FMN transferase [Sphingomonas sp. QA11]|uniref:FAD:protein FMN transferase n=1 Tax=Sphingomonas sp. QA11 TaxID=2950605 RepID=UPI00234A7664|nr:FAD:protein FMN transferase [Sphingomonas sp. QA11]WCM29894.1 FAD:protein FMN transferase [Sphingomonas sp. QA11]
MGTSWSARVVSPRPASDIRAAIKRALDGVIAEMSNWEPDSDLSRFNRAPPGQWQALPADLLQVLDAGLAVARASGGAFDPTAGALVDLWGFGPAGRGALPAETEVMAAPVGWRKLEISETRARRTADVRLDLSGIAKGFGVDALARALHGLGAGDFLAEIGGELVGAGVKPDGEPWWVELEAPPGARIAPLRVALHDLAVATSGDYRRFFETGGRRYAHSIDPRTRRPVANGIAAVTVLNPRCMLADAWATALTVLGPEEGLALAIREGLAVRFVIRDASGYREILSPALDEMLG